MAERIIIQCPGCSTKLGLADASKLGKKIRCSKCSEVFVAQALKSAVKKSLVGKPAAKPIAKKPAKKSDDDEFNFDDTEMEDQSDFENDEQEDEVPVRSKSGGKKVVAKGKGKKKSGGSPLPLIIGGAVAAVLLLGVGAYFLFSSKKDEPVAAQPEAPVAAMPVAAPQNFPNDRLLGLKWMPPETELIIHLKVSEIWTAPILKPLLENPQIQAAIVQVQQFSGLAPTDIESVTFGAKDLQSVQANGAMAALGSGPKAMPGLCVIRSTKPVEPSMLLSQIVQTSGPQFKLSDRTGKSYLEGAPNAQGLVYGAWFADSNTMLMGTTTELFAAMDRGETATPKDAFRKMDASSQLVFAFSPKDSTAMSASLPPAGPTDPPAMTEMVNAFRSGTDGLSIGLSLKSGADLKTSFVFKDSTAVSKIKPGVDALIGQMRQDLTSKQSTAPPLMFELGNILLNNVAVSEQGQVAMISTKIPDSDQQKLEQLPGMLIGMALSRGFRQPNLVGQQPGSPTPSAPAQPNAPASPIPASSANPTPPTSPKP